MTMGKILKLRVVLDTEADVFRDIEIAGDAPLVHLHAATLDAFGWEGMELASFYESNDDWDKGEEIPLMPMPELDGQAAARDMENMTVGALLPTLTSKAVYVYDFLRMWCFYVEPLEWVEPVPGEGYPRLVMEFGVAPSQESKAPEGVNDADLLAALGMDAADDDRPMKTGDPEIDSYFDDDDEDDMDGPEFTNIDDLDDLY